MKSLSAEKLHQRAIMALNNAEYVKSHQLLVELVGLKPHHADAYFLLAMINVNVGQINKAIKLLKKALSYGFLYEYNAHLAKCYALAGELASAKTCCEQVDASLIQSALTADTYGVALSRVGLHNLALPFFQRAILLEPNTAAYQYNYGISLKFLGLFAQAYTAFEQAIECDYLHVQSHFALVDVAKITHENNHLKRLLQVQQQVNTTDEQLIISHAIAKEYEALTCYKDAFDALIVAKQNKRKRIGYRFVDDNNMFDQLTAMLSKNINPSGLSCADGSAIFVTGMPRTGTTVVERMLSQANVHSAGELNDFSLLVKQLSNDNSPYILNQHVVASAECIDFKCLGELYVKKTQALNAGTVRFIDKMPLNVLYSQFILTALPNAKIICLDRNPLDTIMSNFRQLFASNYSLYRYALDLDDTYQFYCRFKQLVEGFINKFPDNFMVVNYEQLVNNPLDIGEKLFKFCQLEWHPSYVKIENNTRSVDTASAVQVRQPISNKAIGQWRHYEPQMADLLKRMANDGFLTGE